MTLTWDVYAIIGATRAARSQVVRVPAPITETARSPHIVQTDRRHDVDINRNITFSSEFELFLKTRN